jgi:hypothetical protein
LANREKEREREREFGHFTKLSGKSINERRSSLKKKFLKNLHQLRHKDAVIKVLSLIDVCFKDVVSERGERESKR